jgi:MFS family permease
MTAVSETQPLNRDQKLAFIAAWLGWAFDGLDGFLYTLVAGPFVASLLTHNGVKPDGSEVAQKAAWIQGAFLIGWALGGAIFGRIGDRIGRTKTLTLTILIYALFTGLGAVAVEWWHLLIYRFIAALGIGGEWAAGSALVTETLPQKYRYWAGAILQSAYMSGQIMAGFAALWFANVDHRYIFIVGVLPAFFTLWLRRHVSEPEEWATKRAKHDLPLRAVFHPKVIKTTILATIVSSVCITTIWGLLYFNLQTLREIAGREGIKPVQINQMVAWQTVIMASVNILGNFACIAIIRMMGVRKGMALIMVLAMGGMYVYSRMNTLADLANWYAVAIFFTGGIFALFPIYFPALFPTLVRTTGAGFAYNFGRVISAGGTFVGGALVSQMKSPQHLMADLALVFIPGILICFFLPEFNQIKHPELGEAVA